MLSLGQLKKVDVYGSKPAILTAQSIWATDMWRYLNKNILYINFLALNESAKVQMKVTWQQLP